MLNRQVPLLADIRANACRFPRARTYDYRSDKRIQVPILLISKALLDLRMVSEPKMMY